MIKRKFPSANPPSLRCVGAKLKGKAIALILALVLVELVPSLALAQEIPAPSFWDPHRRVERPDTSALRLIRFITEDDYPPFNFALPDGTLTGFNVELARAICEELKVTCTIQPRRWDTIVPTIGEGRADAAIASLANNAQNRSQLAFTAPYYKTPARFVVRSDADAPLDARPETLEGVTVGVQEKTAHAAFLTRFFPKSDIRTYPDQATLRAALKNREIKTIFGDGVSLALWLNGTDAAGCCRFAGGPYLQDAYFGEGVGIAVRKGNDDLRRALDYALKRLQERGVYAEIYLKFFPIGFF